MADENIVIGIRGDVEGGKVVKRTLDDITTSEAKAQKGAKDLETQFRNVDGAAQFLKRTLQGLGIAFGIRELQQMVDIYTNIQNRLKLVTTGTQELSAVTQELFRISNATRVAFEGTAEVYARVALATKDLGLSQRQTLQFSESLNQAVVLSGASAAEAGAALIQLSQGLASGALRGDELRSVLEQLPAVADVIAKSLGITRGQLRQMGQDGKITADIIIEAFAKAQNELAENFAKTVPTIGQSFVVLRNHVIEYIGEVDKATGASTEIARVILGLGDNIKILSEILFASVAAWAAFRTAVYITSIQLTAVVAAITGPAALVAALGAAVVAAFVFRDELSAAVIKPLAEAVIWADKAAASLGKLFNQQWSLSGTSPEDLRTAANDMILGDLTKPKTDGISDKKGTRRDTPTTEALEQTKTAQTELKKLIKETSTEQETLLRKIAELDKLKPYAKSKEELEAITRAQNIYNEQLKTASDTYIPGVENGMKRLLQQTDQFAKSAADAFSDFVSGAKSGKEALYDLVGALQKMFFQETITNPLSDMLRGALKSSGSGGFLSGIGSSLGSVFGSIGNGIKGLFGFDSGGSMILGGKPGIDQNILSLNGAPIAKTGRGETLSISPNQKGSGGASVIVQQTINISTGVAATVAAEIQSLLPKIQESAIAGVRESQLRGIT